MEIFSFIQRRLESFRVALRGLRDICRTEHNAWVHMFCTVSALILSLWLRIGRMEFLMITVAISLVWITEAFNTVLEIVIDIVSPEYTNAARRAKDIAAAAVLVASIGAFIIGIIVFLPKLCSG